MRFALILTLLFSPQLFAREAGRHYSVLVDYSLLENWVPSKYGVSFVYRYSAFSSLEAEYVRGSLGFGYFGLELGRIAEQRVALLWRSYGKRNSFNLIAGAYYNSLDIALGNRYLSTVLSGERASVDVMRLNTLGLTLGLGNRWQTKRGFTWSLDWLTVNIPLFTLNQNTNFIDKTTDPDVQRNVQGAVDLFKRFPELAVLKLQLGFSF